MTKGRRVFWLGILYMVGVFHCSAQTTFDKSYKPITSGSVVQDKDFYLFTLMEQTPWTKIWKEDTFFQRKMIYYDTVLSHIASNHSMAPQEFVRAFLWSPEDIASAGHELALIAARHGDAGEGLVRALRRSGYYIRYDPVEDSTLLRKAWEDATNSMDKVIRNYTTNKGFRYASIDSATFAPGTAIAREMLGEALMVLWHHRDSISLFFQPSLSVALSILYINNRDEAARFEPMDSTNALPYARIPVIHWENYPFSMILLPGEGPENEWSISPMGKYRCQLGAEAYKQGKAPFIVVSGGYVHPFQTPYCEAAEMKSYLVATLGIPPEAVILEPHARHTTTNIRNTNRILFRKGVPPDRRVLCVSTAGQIVYIASKFFGARCQFEMGYVPYRDMIQLDPFSVSYLPDISSLQMDATDPLDP